MQPTTNQEIYTSPALTRIGSFEQVTLGAANGNRLDANYPVTTPKSQLTFS